MIRPRNTAVLASILVASYTFIVYLPSLGNEFVNWDDDRYIYLNLAIKSFDLTLLKYAFSLDLSNWHPLTLLTHALDYTIWGLNPRGHYLTNIIFHALNTGLVFFLFALLSKPMVVTLPVVIIILDYYLFERLTAKEEKRFVWLEKIPFLWQASLFLSPRFGCSMQEVLCRQWGHSLWQFASVSRYAPISSIFGK